MSRVLPAGWSEAELGEICLPVSQRGPGSERSDFRYVDLGALDNQTKRVAEPNTVPVSQAPSRAKQIIKAGDVVFSTVRVYLENIALIPPELDGEVASTAFCVLRAAKGIDARYLYYYVTSRPFILAVNALQRGNSPPSVQDRDVRRQTIPIPPSLEQDRIASRIDQVFSRIDEAERALERAQRLLGHYRQSVLKAAVTGELTRKWREQNKENSESAEALLKRILKARREAWENAQLDKMKAKCVTPSNENWRHRYKAPSEPDLTKLPNLPDGWTWASVDQLSTEVTYGTSAKCNDDPSGVPVVRMGNINDGHLNLMDLKYLPRLHPEFPSLLLRAGDLLFNRTNSAELVGKCAVFSGIDGDWSFASYLIRVRVLGVHPEWIAYYINSVLGRAWIGAVKSQQVGQANVNGSKLKALAIPLPPANEMTLALDMVAQELGRAHAAGKSNENEASRVIALRQAVLTTAFSGRLVKQDALDEPAEVLLKRIAVKRRADNRSAGLGPKRKTSA